MKKPLKISYLLIGNSIYARRNKKWYESIISDNTIIKLLGDRHVSKEKIKKETT